MKKTLLWVIFGIFLILIISPIDLAPGPLDDIIYGVLDVVVVALLGSLRKKETKKKELAEKTPPAVIDQKPE